MRKGISPLVASVLLIAITIAIAAILASWVSTYTEQALPSTSCVGGSINFVSAEYPKWTDSSQVLAVVEARHVTLSDFKVIVLMNDDTVVTYENTGTGASTEIAAGSIGTVITSSLPIAEANIKAVQITTNCPDVKTGLTALK